MIDKLKLLTRPAAVILFMFIASLFSAHVVAQEVLISDTTVSTEVTFMSTEKIIAGPDVTISGSGVVTFRARNGVAVLPRVYILGGGQLYVMTGVVAAIETEEEIALPTEFIVYQNYPNPFNPNTKIRYVLPAAEEVTADIYTIYGEKVRTLFSGRQQSGQHSLVWNGTNQAGQKMSSGIYYMRIEAGDYRSVLKMTLLK